MIVMSLYSDVWFGLGYNKNKLRGNKIPKEQRFIPLNPKILKYQRPFRKIIFVLLSRFY